MQAQQWDAIWLNARIATMEASHIPYGLVDKAAIAIKNEEIAWIGSVDELPAFTAKETHDVKGACITPGFIDCHTHIVYAGNRYYEFELRLQGASYEAIARAGGGIASTVTATRAASEESLLEQSLKRAKFLAASGVTTIEIKSGYGLDLETEIKILRVAKRIGEILPITVSPTFLGAHTLPPEYKDRSDQYIDMICHDVLPSILEENLATAVDVFCENIAFDLAQTERVFKTAREFKLGIKCHAEQLSNMGASQLAAQYQALSVDHLEFLSKEGVEALAKSGTVAVLLPGAFYFLRETKLPPIELLRQKNIPIAIASDCNPGTSPVTSLLLMLNMACTLFRLTPEEALLGVTRHGAKALGLASSLGTLKPGKKADFIVWDVEHPAELAYQIGLNPLVSRIKNGLQSNINLTM